MLASVRQGFAPGTRKNLAVQRARYMQFCRKFRRRPFPADLETICLFTQYISRSFKSVDAVINYVQGIKTIHLLRGLAVHPFEHKVLRILFKGLRRSKAHTIRQALPITLDILLDICSRLALNHIEDAVFWSLCLVAFFCILRKSNLVPNSAQGFNPKQQLRRGDVLVTRSAKLVRKRWTKTIQFGQRQLVIPVLGIPRSQLCPVAAYQHMCKAVPAHAGAPAFCVPGDTGLLPYTYRQWQSKLKAILRQTGRIEHKYSSHSFRRGGASFAYKAGASVEMVKMLGDWRSDSFRRYLHLPMETKQSVAALIRDAITY